MSARWRFMLGCFAVSAATVAGDGGALVLSRAAGPYFVTILVSPVPPRVGPMDVSVVVSDPATGKMIDDVTVNLRLIRAGDAGEPMSEMATTEASTTKVYRAASFSVPEQGGWTLEASIEGTRGAGRASTEIAVAAARPRWLDLTGWILLPFPVIGLFVVREHRRSRSSSKRSALSRVPVSIRASR